MTGNDNYSHGISDGILYYDEIKPGVPWEGLISFGEKSPQSKKTPVYYFGEKIAEIMDAHDFAGTLTCYTYPEELEPFMGYYEDPKTGLVFDEQEPKTGFSISYKTQIGNGGDYKLHFLWNLSLDTSQYDYQTDSNSPNATTFPIEITGVPIKVYGKKAVHMVLDSRKVRKDLMNRFSERAKTLPFNELLSYFDYVQDAPFYGLQKVGGFERGHNLVLNPTDFIRFPKPALPGARVYIKSHIEHNVNDTMSNPTVFLLKAKDAITGVYSDWNSKAILDFSANVSLSRSNAYGGGLYAYGQNGAMIVRDFIVPEGVIVDGYIHCAWDGAANMFMVKSEAKVDYFSDPIPYYRLNRLAPNSGFVYGTTQDASGSGVHPKQSQTVVITPPSDHVTTSFALVNANRTSTDDPYTWVHMYEGGKITTDQNLLDKVLAYLKGLGYNAQLTSVGSQKSILVTHTGKKGFIRLQLPTLKSGIELRLIWGIHGNSGGLENYVYGNAISYPNPAVSF